MTIKVVDRLFETTSTTGTGPITLNGAQTGFQPFSTVGSGGKVLYQINDGNSSGVVNNWEIGIGTFTNPNILARTTILASSNANAAVSFGGGTKNVIGTIAAKALPTRDENLNFVEGFGIMAGTANALTLTLPTPPLAYSDGMVISGFLTTTNTTAGATVNVNGIGAVPIKISGADPGIGKIPNGYLFQARYKAASGYFDMFSPIPNQLPVQTGNDKKFLTTDGSNTSWAAGMLNYNNMLYVRDEKTSGTNAANSSAGATQARALNTVVTNNIAGASLASNQITLPAGTYWVEASGGMCGNNVASKHKLRLYNVTTSSYIAEGRNAATNPDTIFTESAIAYPIVLAATSVIELRHYTAVANFFGLAISQGVEVYAELKAWKVS